SRRVRWRESCRHFCFHSVNLLEPFAHRREQLRKLAARLFRRAPGLENLFEQCHDARFIVHHGLSGFGGALTSGGGSATIIDVTSAQSCRHCSRSASGNFASSNGSRTLAKAGSAFHVESGGAETVESFIIRLMSIRSARRNSSAFWRSRTCS